VVEVADLTFDESQHLAGLIAGELGEVVVAAVGLGDPELDECPASGDKVAEFGLFFRGFDVISGLDRPAVPGEDDGIDGVGLFESSQAACELADALGVDGGGLDGGVKEFGGQAAV
jgi:hypothetical protein